MRSIFYALGPKFKPGCSAPWIKLVDQYQVFKHVLGIDGEEHSGSWDRVKDMMMVE